MITLKPEPMEADDSMSSTTSPPADVNVVVVERQLSLDPQSPADLVVSSKCAPTGATLITDAPAMSHGDAEGDGHVLSNSSNNSDHHHHHPHSSSRLEYHNGHSESSYDSSHSDEGRGRRRHHHNHRRHRRHSAKDDSDSFYETDDDSDGSSDDSDDSYSRRSGGDRHHSRSSSLKYTDIGVSSSSSRRSSSKGRHHHRHHRRHHHKSSHKHSSSSRRHADSPDYDTTSYRSRNSRSERGHHSQESSTHQHSSKSRSSSGRQHRFKNGDPEDHHEVANGNHSESPEVGTAYRSSLIDYNALASKCALSMATNNSDIAANDMDYRLCGSNSNESRSGNRVLKQCTVSDQNGPHSPVEPYDPEFPCPRPLLPFAQFKLPNLSHRMMGPPPPPPPPHFGPPPFLSPSNGLMRPNFFRFPPPPPPPPSDMLFPGCLHNGGPRRDLLYLTGQDGPPRGGVSGGRPLFGPGNGFSPRFYPRFRSAPFSSYKRLRRPSLNDDLPEQQQQPPTDESSSSNNKADLPKIAESSPDDNVLFLRYIPLELNKMEPLNKHFSKFGTVCNIEIGYQNDPDAAMIQFFSAEEARRAFRSAEAVFNNRFIKVYWGTIGRKAFNKIAANQKNGGDGGAQCKSPIKNTSGSTPSNPNRASFRSPSSASFPTKSPVVITPPAKNFTVLEREALIKEANADYLQLNEQLSNQKLLMSKLTKATTAHEKSSLKDLLKLAMYNIKELQKSLKIKQGMIKQAQRTVKVNSERKRSLSTSSVTSNHSGSAAGNDSSNLNIQVSSDEEEDEEVLPTAKRHRSEDSSSSEAP